MEMTKKYSEEINGTQVPKTLLGRLPSMNKNKKEKKYPKVFFISFC